MLRRFTTSKQSPRLLLGFVLISVAASVTLAGPVSAVRTGLILGHPHFSIRQTTTVTGVPVDFSTSRPKDNTGWFIEGDRIWSPASHFGYGVVAGARIWQTGYWLNWEVPERGVSLDPLRSWWVAAYLHGGALVWAGIGPLRLVPSVNIVFGSSSFELKNASERESGSDLLLGLMPGIEGRIRIWRKISCSAGYKTALFLNRNPDYEVEPGVTLTGKHSADPEELFFGVTFWER